MNIIDQFRDLSSGIQIVIVLVALALLALLAYTLRQWWRTPANQLRLLPKWAWFITILISQPLGPALFLGFGRLPAVSPDSAPRADATAKSDTDIVDILYGKDAKE